MLKNLNNCHLIKLIISISLSTAASTSAQAFINEKDSGFYTSIAAGVATSRASATWDSVLTGNEYNFTAPTTTGGSASLRFGYQVAFGERDNLSEVYVGGGVNYSLLGNMVTNVSGIGDPSVNAPDYTQSSVSQFGAELYVGKYWYSPLYTDVFISPGFSSSGSFFTTLGLRIGYSLTDNVKVFLQGSTGAQFDYSTPAVSAVFWQLGGSKTSYSTGLMGIQYTF